MRKIYIDMCLQSLPKLLAMYDLDPFSKTKGIGDREYWGWKSRDYINASLQGGALGLAVFLKLGYFNKSENKILELISRIIDAVYSIKYKNNSVDEIMPYEGSFCVAASLTVDILLTIKLLDDFFTKNKKERYLNLSKELISFYINNIEKHGIISNHLAAGVAGIYQYKMMTGDPSFDYHAKQLLNTILENQSEEGWYKEYEGADPGYQTLCTYYLALAYKITRERSLLQSLQRSIEYLAYFIHPDGSIGGEYGSRNTQIYYPAGFEILGDEIPLAGQIAVFMRQAIVNNDTITLEIVDKGNYIPYFNNYMIAYLEGCTGVGLTKKNRLPFEKESFHFLFPKSGIFIVNTDKYYAILNFKKGGILKVFDKYRKKMILDDCGYIGALNKGKIITSQIYSEQVEYEIIKNGLRLCKCFYSVPENYPTPWKFVVLRLFNMSIMRNKTLNRLIKLLLVKLLITNKYEYKIILKRELTFTKDVIFVKDILVNQTHYTFKWLEYGRKFSSIHMASSKYFNKHYLNNENIYCIIDIKKFNEQKKIEIKNKVIFKE